MSEYSPNFVWINGTINAGKSTMAHQLHQLITRSVNIELDAFSAFASQIPVDEKLDYLIEDALQIAAHWHKRNYLPIINGPIYGAELQLMQKLSQQLGLHPLLITLTPLKTIVKQNRGSRQLTDWERSRIDYHYDQCRITEQGFGYCFDNSKLDVEASASALLQLIQEKIML